MATHTPGPWYEDGLLFIGVDKDGNGKGWFDLSGGDGEYTAEEAEANTKLCAAAPELLAVARDLADYRVGGPEVARPVLRGIIGRARAAIARAEGRAHE